MAEDKRGLLTLAAFFISIVVGILLYAAQLIDWISIVPVVLLVFGIWMLALASMRGSNPDKYGPTAFNTLSIGLVLIAVGGAWYLFRFGWLYSIALLLIVFAVLAVAAALKRK